MAFDERNQGSSFLLAVIDYDLRMKRSAFSSEKKITKSLKIAKLGIGLEDWKV
jgi:hypothetical protein